MHRLISAQLIMYVKGAFNVKKICRLFLILIVICFSATSASAELFYTLTDYATGTIGRISGTESPQTSVIQNLNGDPFVFAFYDLNGKPRIAGVSRDSWVANGDEWKVYNPFAGTGWNSSPEAEFLTKYIEGDYASTVDGNVHAVATIGDYMYLAYWGNTYNSFGQDHSSKLVKLDMANNYEKVAEYLYEPDPNYSPSDSNSIAANCADVYAYNGKIYGVYTGYKGNQYADTSVVIEFDQDLNPLRTCNLAALNIYGAQCFSRGKLYISSVGGSVYGTEPTNPLSCVEVVDLESMTAETLVTTASMQKADQSWKLNFGGVAVTDDGTIYLQCFYFSMSELTYPMKIFKTTYEKLKSGDIGDLVKEISFSGWSLGMVYDKYTKLLWVAAGTDLYRYDGSSWVTFDSTALGGNIYNLAITSDVSRPMITTVRPDGALVGEEYNFALTASVTESLEWSIISGELPVGLSLDANTGVISGTAESAGTYTFTVKVENVAGESLTEMTLTVTDERVAPTIVTEELPEATVGAEYKAGIEVEGTGPMAWSVVDGELPEGLLLNAETGEISGTPVTAGDYNFTVKASNAVGESLMDYTLTVAEAASSGGGGGGGGCNSGAGALALLALLPIVALRKKK